MRKQIMRACLLASALAIVPASAHAEADDTVKRAQALVAQKRADEAYSLLLPQVEKRAGDPDFDLALGIAASDSGHHAQAIIAFQRVLAVQPNDAQAKAELGRAYAMAGDIDTARAEFRTVLNDPTVPDPVRQRIDGVVRNLDRRAGEGGVEITGFFDASAGYDSNVNTATDATSITLPALAFLGPATLNGAAREQGDEFYQLQGGLSLSAPLSRQTRGFVSALGNYRDNFDIDFVDQASLTGTAGLVHSLLNGDAISLSGQVQRFWLKDEGYRTTYGVVGQYTARISPTQALAIAAQYYRLDYDGSPLQDADRYALSATFSGRNVYAGVGAGIEDTVRKGAEHLGHMLVNAQLGGEYPVAPKLALLGGAAVEYRAYESRDPLYLEPRDDVQFDASLGLRYAIAGGISVRPRVTYTVNDSDLELYDYDRFTASFGLRYDF